MAISETSTQASSGESDPRLIRRFAPVLLTAVALLPVAITLLTRTGRQFVPLGDAAVIDLRVRDVWSTSVPLVGSYSRFGWNHPGPALYWLLAPLSGIFGRPAWATLVGSALLQGVAIVALAWLAWRRGGIVLLSVALAADALAYGGIGYLAYLLPWNPTVAFPFFLLFVLQAWFLARGDVRLLPWTILVATFLVQCHVGYLPLVGVGLVFAIASLGWRTRRGFDVGTVRSSVRWSALVVGVTWLPALVHELVHEDNVGPLFRSMFGAKAEDPLGLSAAAGFIGDEFRIWPQWLGGHERVSPFDGHLVPASSWLLLIPVALLAVAALALRGCPPSAELGALVALTALLVVVGTWSISRVIGAAERYVFFWRVPLAILVVLVAGAALWYATGLHRFAFASRVLVAVTASVVVIASATTAARIARLDDVSTFEPTARDAVAAVKAGVDDRTVLVRTPRIGNHGLHRGVVNELARAGADVKVDRDLGFMFGYSRAADPNDVDEIWYVTEAGSDTMRLLAEPGARLVWSTTPLPPADERELDRRQHEVWQELEAQRRRGDVPLLDSHLVGFALDRMPNVEHQVLDRIGALNELVDASGSCRCAVVALPPGAQPRL